MPTHSFDRYLKHLEDDPETAQALEEERLVLNVSDAINKARLDSGLTQRQLAERSGISRITITRIENGQFNPSIRTIAALAHAMGKKATVTID
ncbi:helix-turn-helix domain-containing protein [Bifidobacterium simiarum]|uniref:helix-turn-helix domain-containing protein n=1 Tax=Bifidobacterium simiarum TaxID=2045441 RepID=UPI001BDD81BB|nr:helix-turn-helix transcriptional regulator [Bifidobacterium simiarum]MBT1166841.1 helix-turn-helix transcriptional regulator [Bifidobacterium simiarum]